MRTRKIITEESKHVENKQNICDKLLITLRETRDFKNLIYLKYEKKKNPGRKERRIQEKRNRRAKGKERAKLNEIKQKCAK